MDGIFKGLKVIELANVLAGPAAGMFFAELGAEVIKIENSSTNGDVTRGWKLASEDKNKNTSAYYASVNWNKKSMMMDIRKSKEKARVYEMISSADIVIANYKAGDAEKLGMDHETLRKLNPGLIYAHLSGFGEANPRTAFDIVLQAETGFMFMNGTKESGPIKMPVALIDILAAHQLKEGILVALIQKLKTGKGSKVTVSLYDAAMASLANQATNWLMAGTDPKPIGSLHPNIAPYGELLISSDNKKIVLAVGNNKQFEKLCQVLNLQKLTGDKRFEENTSRVSNREELLKLLQNEAKKRTAEDLMLAFINNDVPAGMIRSVKEVLESASAKKLILKEKDEYNTDTLRMRSAIFNITN